jgi:hypothetical protein
MITKKLQKTSRMIDLIQGTVRDTVVEHRTTTANQIKALLYHHGLISPISKKKICPKSYFNNERELFSYTGLTPSEHSSGGHVRKGHISRKLLIEQAREAKNGWRNE